MRSLLAASATLRPGQIVPKNQPEILLQSELVESDGKHQDGVLVKATRWVWQEIQAAIQQDPTVLTHFAQNPRAFEEFIAGAYEKDGWDEVILTPRSNDGGRDVIAIKHGYGTIRFLEQAKAYSPGHKVTHNDVRAMLGVLQTDGNTSKGLITTTSDFQPGILTGDEFKNFMPHRLELKNGTDIVDWLKGLSD